MIELTPLSFTAVAAVVPVMIFAGLVHGALGLGFPLVATPLIAVFLDVRLAIVITLLPTAAVNVASITSQHSFKWVARRYLPLALASLAGALAGAAVLAYTETELFRLLLALLIAIFLITEHGPGLPADWIDSHRIPLLIMVGLLAGFSAGTTNVMVAVLLIYFLAAGVARSEMVGAMNLCFLIGKLSQMVVFFLSGLVDVAVLLKTLPLAVIALAALYVGQRMGKQIPKERYSRWLRYLLAALAIILLIQFIR